MSQCGAIKEGLMRTRFWVGQGSPVYNSEMILPSVMYEKKTVWASVNTARQAKDISTVHD